MRLSKDIFKVTKENKLFLRYLFHHPGFTIQQIVEKFPLTYDATFKKLQEWEKQGYIIRDKLTPELGGTKYTYSLSEKGIEELKKLFSLEL